MAVGFTSPRSLFILGVLSTPTKPSLCLIPNQSCPVKTVFTLELIFSEAEPCSLGSRRYKNQTVTVLELEHVHPRTPIAFDPENVRTQAPNVPAQIQRNMVFRELSKRAFELVEPRGIEPLTS